MSVNRVKSEERGHGGQMMWNNALQAPDTTPAFYQLQLKNRHLKYVMVKAPDSAFGVAN